MDGYCLYQYFAKLRRLMTLELTFDYMAECGCF